MIEKEMLDLLGQHTPALFVATLMFLLLRGLAGDITWFPTLPEVITLPLVGWKFRGSRLKPWLNVLVAVTGGLIEHLKLGKTWGEAAKSAFIVSALPTLMYELGLLKPAKPMPTPAEVEASRVSRPPMLPVLLLAFVGIFSVGCIGSFEEAKLESEYKATSEMPSAEKVKRCDSIDSSQLIWGATTAILAGAAGANGVTAFKVSNPDTKEVLVLVAGGAGLAALGTTFIWNHYTKKYVAEGCGQ